MANTKSTSEKTGPRESSYLLPDQTEREILIVALYHYRFRLMGDLGLSSKDPNDPDVAGLEEFLARASDLMSRIRNLKLEGD